LSPKVSAQVPLNAYVAEVSQETLIQSTSNYPYQNKSGTTIPISMSSGGSSELTEAQTYSSSLSGTNYSTSGTVTVSANAQPGSVGMQLSGNATATISGMTTATTGSNTTLIATVNDFVTFAGPSLPVGEPVTVVAAMTLNASLSNSGSAPAYAYYSGGVSVTIAANIQAGSMNFSQSWTGSNGVGDGGGASTSSPLPITILLPLTFSNEVQMPLNYTIELTGGGSASGAFTGATTNPPGGLGTVSDNYNVDVTHSLDWAGISGDPIDQDTGLPVTDWSITSASGFNYANAVPEPTTWAIALCSITLACTQRTRRWQRPRKSQISFGQ
jgi:hypothetical protein